MDNFNAYSQYYDLLYKDKNYRAESGYVFDLIQRYHPDTRSVLELGCGSGAHAEHLCQQGLKVTGIERSESMVNLAKEKKIAGFSPIVGDISSFSLEDRFDTAISLFHVISYLTKNTELLRCFEQTSKHLHPGGLFIFDIWYSPAVYFQKPETRVKKMENELANITRTAESEMDTTRNVVNVHFTIDVQHKKNNDHHTFTELHPMRHFSYPEIELIAGQTGFTILLAEEFLTGKTPGTGTWGVCFVLQKNKQ
jgi:SAM-dependent methyltransferase